MLEENVKIINQYNCIKSEMEVMYSNYTKNILPQSNELKALNRSLKNQVKHSLSLVEEATRQKDMIEEKYNLTKNKTLIDPKERVLYKMLGEFQIEYDATLMLVE